MKKYLRCSKMMCALILAILLLVGCGDGVQEETTESTQVLRKNALINMEWREFTMTNAEGKRLVLDLSETEYPEGDMPHGDFGSIPGTPAILFFDVAYSDRFIMEPGGGRFDCGITAETYGGYVHGEDVKNAVISNGEVSIEGEPGVIAVCMEMPDLGWELRLEGETEGKTVMTRSGSTVTITGVAGDYSLMAAEEDASYSEPIEKTAQTGTLVIDLSRIGEHILTITDGDEVTEHKVKMP